jgi:hypothetical protein
VPFSIGIGRVVVTIVEPNRSERFTSLDQGLHRVQHADPSETHVRPGERAHPEISVAQRHPRDGALVVGGGKLPFDPARRFLCHRRVVEHMPRHHQPTRWIEHLDHAIDGRATIFHDPIDVLGAGFEGRLESSPVEVARRVLRVDHCVPDDIRRSLDEDVVDVNRCGHVMLLWVAWVGRVCPCAVLVG